MSRIRTPKRVGRGGAKGPRGFQRACNGGNHKSGAGLAPKYTWATSEKEFCATPEEREVLTERALELRLEGHTYERIGKFVGYSYRSVHRFIEEALARRKEITDELAARLRKLQLARLERIYAAHAPNIADYKSATIMLKVLEREARLLGLDASDSVGFLQKEPEQAYHFSRLTVDQLNALHDLLAIAAAGVVRAGDETTSAAPLAA